MPNLAVICIGGRPLLSSKATASRLNSGVNSRRDLAIKRLPCSSRAYQRRPPKRGRITYASSWLHSLKSWNLQKTRRGSILWNTVYLGRAVGHLRHEGIDVPERLLAHVAPLGWEHVGVTGDYLWGGIDKPRERFRPLRTTGSAGRA